MSISNLYTGNKEWQNIFANTITCNTLDAQNIIGSITQQEVETDSIATFSTGNIEVVSNMIHTDSNIEITGLSKGIYIKDNPAWVNNSSCDIHTMSNQNIHWFMEADINNSGESDLPFLIMSYDGGLTQNSMQGGNNYMVFQCASSTSNLGFIFRTGTIVGPQTQGTPATVVDPVERFRITPSLITASLPLSLNNNIINNIGSISINKQVVSQSTSITTAVTSNTSCGKITTQSFVLAGDAYTTFSVNSSAVSTSSVVHLTLNNYSNWSAGFPSLAVGNITNGSFSIYIHNTSSVAINGSLIIGYTIN